MHEEGSSMNSFSFLVGGQHHQRSFLLNLYFFIQWIIIKIITLIVVVYKNYFHVFFLGSTYFLGI